MDTISNIFENFYDSVFKNFLVEAKSMKRKKPVVKNLLVSYEDGPDKELKAEILSPEDNKLKTESIISFLLSRNLFEYFWHEIYPLLVEGSHAFKYKQYSATNKPPYDEVKNSGKLKEYQKLFSRAYNRYVKENSFLSEQDYFDKIFMPSDTYWNAYQEKLENAKKFYMFYIKSLHISSGSTQLLRATDPSARETIFKTLVAEPYFCASEKDRSCLSTKKTLYVFSENGFNDTKLRDCPAFTNDMNVDDTHEMSFKFIKSPIMNVFDPSEVDLSDIQSAVSAKKTFAEAFHFTANTQANIDNTLSSIRKTTDSYVKTKYNNLKSIKTFFNEPVISVTDALTKLEKVIDFIQDTSLTPFEAKRYLELKSNLNNNTIGNMTDSQFKSINQLKTAFHSHLEDSLPNYIKIATLAQLLFSNVNKKTKDQSVKRLLNPVTDKMINFIVPTTNLKKTIDLDRMGMSFFALSSSNEKILDRKFDALLSNVIYNPIYVTSNRSSSEYLQLQSAAKTIQTTLNGFLSESNKNNTKKLETRRYFINNQGIESFIKEVKDQGAEVNTATGEIGTYVNDNMNYNVIVQFENFNTREPITQNNIWKHTRILEKAVNFDDNEYKSLKIITPIFPISTKFNQITKVIERSGNFKSASEETHAKNLNLKDKNDFLSKKDEVSKLLAREILNNIFDTIFAANVEKNDEFYEALFNQNKKEAFLDNLCLNLQFDEKDLNGISSIEALADFIRSFFIRADIWKLILYAYIYYSLMLSDENVFELNNVDSKNPKSESEKPESDSSSYSLDYCRQKVERIMKETERNFASSINSKTARTLEGVLSEETPFHERSDFSKALSNIFKSIIESNYIYAGYGAYVRYVKNNETKIPNFSQMMIKLQKAVEAAIQPNLSSAVNIQMENGFDLLNANIELNKIGKFFMDVLDRLVEQKKGFPYDLTFEGSKDIFISLMNEAGTIPHKNLRESFYEVIKMFLYITYMLYLVLTVCKTKQEIFIPAKIKTNVIQSENSGDEEDDSMETYKYSPLPNRYEPKTGGIGYDDQTDINF